jgi:hypothetical protein
MAGYPGSCAQTHHTLQMSLILKDWKLTRRHWLYHMEWRKLPDCLDKLPPKADDCGIKCRDPAGDLGSLRVSIR